MRLLGTALISAPVLALVACSTSTAAPRGSDSASASIDVTSARSACPAATGTLTWPAAVPRYVPKPPGGTVTAVKKLPPASPGGKAGVVVSVTVPTGLHEEVVYVTLLDVSARPLRPWPGRRGGGRADIPFRRADVTGQLRLRRTGECATTWILTLLPRR